MANQSKERNLRTSEERGYNRSHGFSSATQQEQQITVKSDNYNSKPKTNEEEVDDQTMVNTDLETVTHCDPPKLTQESIEKHNKTIYHANTTTTKKLIVPKLRLKSKSSKPLLNNRNLEDNSKHQLQSIPTPESIPSNSFRTRQHKKRKFSNLTESSNSSTSRSTSGSTSRSSSGSSTSSSESYRSKAKRTRYNNRHSTHYSKRYRIPNSYSSSRSSNRRHKRQRLNEDKDSYKNRFLELNKLLLVSFAGGYCLPLAFKLYYRLFHG